MPQAPHPSIGEVRDPHQQLLGVLQVPCPRLFCALWSRQCRTLLEFKQTSTRQLLLTITSRQNEVLLQQKPLHEHVQLRQEPGEIVP